MFVYLSPSSVFLCTWKKKQCKTKKITAASASVCQLLPTAQSEVMKVEYWPAKFLFTSFMDGDGVEVSHLDRTNLVNKGSIHGYSGYSRGGEIYGLLTKCEVKVVGYWPSYFLRVYGPRRSRGP